MKTVLRTVPSFFPYVTGPATQARAISRGLESFGYQSRVVTTNLGADAAPSRDKIDGVEVTRLPIHTGFMQYHVAPGVWKELKSQPADIIHVHSFRNFLADVAAIVARRRHIPLILHLHGSLTSYRQIVHHNRQWLYTAYDLLTSSLPTLRADKIIVSTDQEAKEASEYGLDERKIVVIPMGCDTEQYRFIDITHEPTKIAFIGRLAEDRNVEQLLHALPLIKDLSWSCMIIGSEERRSYTSRFGYLDYLRQLAIDLGIAERVIFTGPKYGKELQRQYAKTGIFVYTSRCENFGQTILEAAAAGCALVTTNVGVASDIIQEGVTGFIVEQDAVKQLAQRLRWLLENPHKQAAIGEAALEAVSRSFAWTPILRRYADLYRNVIDDYRVP